jgi:hypothetical protein
MDEPTFNDDIWHADDCGGPPFCDGCGWIDARLVWWPGPCPDNNASSSSHALRECQGVVAALRFGQPAVTTHAS